ncbi:MAG: hypothetical protein ABIJ46_02885 [bacterium]
MRHIFLAALMAAAALCVACDDGGTNPPVDCADPGKADTWECADDDGDGVPNANDNCPDIANPANSSGFQVDSDDDGIGDACDEDSGCEPGPMRIVSSELSEDGVHVRLQFNSNPDYLISHLEGVRCVELCGLAWGGAHLEPIPVIAVDDENDGWMDVEVILGSSATYPIVYRPLGEDCQPYYQDPCAEGNWDQPYGDPALLAGMCSDGVGYVNHSDSNGWRLAIEISYDGDAIPAGNQRPPTVGGD